MAKGADEKPLQKDVAQSPLIKTRFGEDEFASLLNPKVSPEDMQKYSQYLSVPSHYSKNTLTTNLDLLNRYLNVQVV